LSTFVAATQLNVGPDMDMKEVGRLVEDQGIQISWSVVSKRMGNRSRLSCFKKWQKLSGVMGNLMGDVDVDAHHPSHHHLHHHDSGLMKRGRRGGDDDDDEDDDDDDFSGLHGDHPLAAGGAPPNKRSKVGEKIEFPQAATAGAAAALAHQHTAQQQHHQQQQQQQQQLQHFNHHHPTHMGMTGTPLHHQQQPPAASIPPTTTPAAAASAAGANSLSNPFRNVVQPTNEVYFDASQAEAIMEAVKLPDPGRLK
jgi:Myb-like DNA-binding domain